ncbi:MAG: type II secretion system F family protein [Candidatus Omnitrophica bacterium]|nr:type II secretion system F family protein [Candidatus Omnitrophota bacterium]
MPVYRYKVRDASGQAITGTVAMESPEATARHLEEKGYIPISIEEEGAVSTMLKPSSFRTRFASVKDKDLNFFTRQMVTLTKAGIPLVAGLQTLRDQTASGTLKGVIAAVVSDLERGESFSSALSHHPRVFSELYVAMVRAGEATGQLDEILFRLVELGEYDTYVKSKIKTATFYPKLIMSIMFLAFLFITTFVLPRFASFFQQAGVELLWTTKFLLWLNFALRNYWYAAIAIVGMFVYGFRYFLKTKVGRRLWDTVNLKIPVFGTLFHQFAMSRFSRVLSITSRSGVPILESLEIVSRSVGNVTISSEVLRLRESVRRGEGLAKPMSEGKLFPPIVIRMVSVGEETGKLDELLLRVSEYYDFEVDNAIQKLTILIEPILLVVLGGMVLFLILSIFVPLLRFYTKIAGGGGR